MTTIRLPMTLATDDDSRQWLETNGFTITHVIQRLGAYTVTLPAGWHLSAFTGAWFVLYNAQGTQR